MWLSSALQTICGRISRYQHAASISNDFVILQMSLQNDMIFFCCSRFSLKSLYFKFYNRSKIWQALRQQYCRCACQIRKRRDYLNINLAALRLHQILRWHVISNIETGPCLHLLIQSTNLSIRPPTYPSIYPSIHPSVYLSLYIFQQILMTHSPLILLSCLSASPHRGTCNKYGMAVTQ